MNNITTKFKKKLFIIIDGTFFAYRAYYTFPFMQNVAREPTGVIYGVINMLRSVIIRYRPSHMAIAFDAQKKTFRNSFFKQYKSHRPRMPDDMRIQIKSLYDIIEAIGISLIIIPGVEADDVIGTIARIAEKIAYKVLIVSNDKDMAQLVTSDINLINSKSNIILGPAEINAKYGIPPEMIVDFIALTGDKSDNIPGIPGIGEKTAKIILKSIGGLKILYSQLDKISMLGFRKSKNIAIRLKQNKEMAYVSYFLATIKTDIKLNLNFEDLKLKPIKYEILIDFFKKYEFKLWINDLLMGRWL